MTEISRREFVKSTLAAGLLGAGSPVLGAANAPRAATATDGPRTSRNAPNILLIHVDQHRFDCLGRAGHPLVKTPNLDRLAAEGMWFESAYTPIPTCCPARQSLLCGQWPERHGGLWNYDITLPVQSFEEKTWTEILPAAGYRMGYVGKWHVHPTRSPLDYGFQDFVSDKDYNKWRRRQGLPATKSLDEDFWFGGVDPAPLEKTHTHWLAEQTVALIRRYQQEGGPWHVRLDPVEPHLPCTPVQQFLDMYDPAAIKPWGNFPDPFNNKPYIQKQQLLNWGLERTTWEAWSRYVQRYLAMIGQLDDAVGRVLRALKEMGLEENTLVVYTADHGDACGGHGMIDKHYIMYEDVVHVPFIVRWPGVVQPGSHSDAFVINELDLAATLPEAAGAAFPCQGRSLLPLLRGQRPADWRSYAFSSYHGAQFGLYCQRMIRDRRWKYVWNPTDVDELYDLREDPWELNNRIGSSEDAGELARLRQALARDLQERGDKLLGGRLIGQLEQGRKQA